MDGALAVWGARVQGHVRGAFPLGSCRARSLHLSEEETRPGARKRFSRSPRCNGCRSSHCCAAGAQLGLSPGAAAARAGPGRGGCEAGCAPRLPCAAPDPQSPSSGRQVGETGLESAEQRQRSPHLSLGLPRGTTAGAARVHGEASSPRVTRGLQPLPADRPCTTSALQVALPPAGPEAEAGTVELYVQTCPETALLAPDGPLLPPALRCPQTAQPGGMEAREQGKCAQAAGPAPPSPPRAGLRLGPRTGRRRRRLSD